MSSGKKARRFPVRRKAVPQKAVSGEPTALNTTPILGGAHNKIIPFPSIPREKTKTKAAILSFPVRA